MVDVGPYFVAPRYCSHGKVIDDECDQCFFEETGHYPTCGVYEGTQAGPCYCKAYSAQGEGSSHG
jgi:hypothetical protein